MLFEFLLFEKMNQRNCIKVCVKSEIKCTTTFEILTMAFGESTISRTQVQFCYNEFPSLSMMMLGCVGMHRVAAKIVPKLLNLLTYLNDHNNPINGFTPAAKRPSRRLCFLRAYSNWSHQSDTLKY